ncbi:MAG: hypothetical protein ACRDTZ_00320 [Pseudonocardiaceae bacterium]
MTVTLCDARPVADTSSTQDPFVFAVSDAVTVVPVDPDPTAPIVSM